MHYDCHHFYYFCTMRLAVLTLDITLTRTRRLTVRQLSAALAREREARTARKLFSMHMLCSALLLILTLHLLLLLMLLLLLQSSFRACLIPQKLILLINHLSGEYQRCSSSTPDTDPAHRLRFEPITVTLVEGPLSLTDRRRRENQPCSFP